MFTGSTAGYIRRGLIWSKQYLIIFEKFKNVKLIDTQMNIYKHKSSNFQRTNKDTSISGTAKLV